MVAVASSLALWSPSLSLRLRHRDTAVQNALESGPQVSCGTLKDGVFCELLAGLGSPGTASGF